MVYTTSCIGYLILYIIDHIVFIVYLLSPHSDHLADQLYLACGHLYNITNVRRYLDEGVDPNHSWYTRVFNGSTPLHWACRCNKPEAVKLLVERGADVAAIDRVTGHTPLHDACFQGSLECVQPLLDHHCDPGECEYD